MNATLQHNKAHLHFTYDEVMKLRALVGEIGISTDAKPQLYIVKASKLEAYISGGQSKYFSHQEIRDFVSNMFDALSPIVQKVFTTK